MTSDELRALILKRKWEKYEKAGKPINPDNF
jgi:hypothetical protein